MAGAADAREDGELLFAEDGVDFGVGLAERRPSSTDRRARIIAVTEKGARTAERSRRIVDGVHERTLAPLPESDRETHLR